MLEFLIALALLAAVAVAVVMVARTDGHFTRRRRGEVEWLTDPDFEPVAYGGLPPGVTCSSTGWYSCPRCSGTPCAQCAQRNWSRRRR
jgi:hypothetical protein